jgi:hypothetical protein
METAMSDVDAEKLAAVMVRLDNPNPADVTPIPVDFDPCGTGLFNVSADKIGRLWAYDHVSRELYMIADPRDAPT